MPPIEADGVNLREDSDLEQLEAVIATFGPTMLVLDSLTALWPGANERRTEDVAPVLYGLKRLAEHHGVAIVVLHHRPKDGGEYRGTTAIAAAAQLGFTLSKAKRATPTAPGGGWGAGSVVQRPNPRTAGSTSTPSTAWCSWARRQPYEDPDEPERTAPAKRELAPRFLGALGSSRRGLSEIASLLDMNPKDGTLRRVADHLVVTGKIVRGDDKKYERFGCQVPPALRELAPWHLAPRSPERKRSPWAPAPSPRSITSACAPKASTPRNGRDRHLRALQVLAGEHAHRDRRRVHGQGRGRRRADTRPGAPPLVHVRAGGRTGRQWPL